MAAHGKTGNGAVLAIFRYVIVGFDLRYYFREECPLKEIQALRLRLGVRPGLSTAMLP